MERILLQEADAHHTGDFDNQLLVIWQYVGADELHDLHQPVFFQQDAAQLFPVSHEFPAYMLLIPRGKIVDIFTVAVVPVDRGIMARIGKALIQRPEAAGKALGILRDRL